MPISERAQRNHDALFPGHTSTLKATDPELVEVFDNWAFDEVIEAAPLDVRTRLIAQLAAIIACQAINEYRVMLGAALEVGVTPVEAKEIVYQAVPYLGMARAFDFLHVTNDVLRDSGIDLPLASQSTTTPSTRFERGLETQRRIFGARIDQMRAQAPRDEAHIQRFLTANCFGDHVTRGGLDARTRELVTFSMLAALGGCEPQLAGHVAGNPGGGQRAAGPPRHLDPAPAVHRVSAHPQRAQSPRRGGTAAGHSMINVLVLGANGQLARNTTRVFLQSTDAKLTLYLRRANRLRNPDPARVKIVEGDVLDAPTLEAAMRGQDVVYANLSGDMKQQAERIVQAMHATGLKRLIMSLDSVSDLIVKLATTPGLEVRRSLGVSRG